MNDPDKDLSRIRSQLRRWDADDIEAGLREFQHRREAGERLDRCISQIQSLQWWGLMRRAGLGFQFRRKRRGRRRLRRGRGRRQRCADRRQWRATPGFSVAAMDRSLPSRRVPPHSTNARVLRSI
jgi:hypothetical protein